MPRYKLPLLVERTFADARHLRTQLAMDFEQRTQEQGKISCRDGCASCCYHPVVISVLEGILLYRWLAERGMWTPSFKKSLQDAADLTNDLSVEVWLLANIPCPLLSKDNRCLAYEARPFNCRTTLSLGDPHYCHPHRIADGSTIVSRVEALHAFHAEERMLLKRHGLRHLFMPLSRAILLGEKVVAVGLDIENVDKVLMDEYVGIHG